MNHANGGAVASGANAQEVPDKLLALTTEALAFISRERAGGMARQWLAGVPLSNSNEQSVLARSLIGACPLMHLFMHHGHHGGHGHSAGSSRPGSEPEQKP